MFSVGTYVCGSCAVASMTDIGLFKNPVEVLSAFCKHELGIKDGRFKTAYGKLTCFYVFCAGPEVKSGEVGGSHHSKDHWPRYGTELAQYIVDNKLGEVVTVGPKKNAKHHPTTTAQLWAWSPDQKAVETWWDEQQKLNTRAETPAPPKTAPVAAKPIVPLDPYEDEDEDDYYEDEDPFEDDEGY